MSAHKPVPRFGWYGQSEINESGLRIGARVHHILEPNEHGEIIAGPNDHGGWATWTVAWESGVGPFDHTDDTLELSEDA